MMRQRRRAIATIAALTAIACGDAGAGRSDNNGPPVSAALDLRPNAPATILQVCIADAGQYAVRIQFQHGKSTRDAEEAYKLLGGAERGHDGSWSEAGVPAQFRVRITTRGISSELVFSREVSNPGTMAGYRSRWATLAEPRLGPGEYTVEVSGISNSTPLQDMPAEAVFGFFAHGK